MMLNPMVKFKFFLFDLSVEFDTENQASLFFFFLKLLIYFDFPKIKKKINYIMYP